GRREIRSGIGLSRSLHHNSGCAETEPHSDAENYREDGVPLPESRHCSLVAFSIVSEVYHVP
ncbi:MAG: hypothetical protein ACREJN_02240, partial [Nitrospiraceae bacterium]